MKLSATFASLFGQYWRAPRKPPEPEPCSDYEAELDNRLALRKAHRLAERAMRG